MNLTLGTFEVRDVVTGEKTFFQNGVLSIDVDRIKETLLEDSVFTAVNIDIVKPGENKRIIHVLDTLEPRAKLGEGQTAFPGQLDTMPVTVGTGTTYRLHGVTVMQCAALPHTAGGLLIAREAIVDMSGPGRYYSPFHEYINIVLSFELAEGYSDIEYESAIRAAGVFVSKHLAETTLNLTPDKIEQWSNDNINPALPNIVYIHQYQSQGIFAHTYSYGRHMFENLPTLMSPNELIDGAIVSGNYLYGCFKTATFLHCNNPVMWELYKGHGVKHNFLGVIIARGHNYTFSEKVRSAQFAAKIAKEIKADGAIITWEGGGNSIIEAMQTVKACENNGIKTVIMGYELGGAAGDELAMLDIVPEADAIVSTGSIDKAISLPPLEPVGGKYLRLSPETGGINIDASEALNFRLSHEMYCGSNHTGFSRLAARNY